MPIGTREWEITRYYKYIGEPKYWQRSFEFRLVITVPADWTRQQVINWVDANIGIVDDAFTTAFEKAFAKKERYQHRQTNLADYQMLERAVGMPVFKEGRHYPAFDGSFVYTEGYSPGEEKITTETFSPIYLPDWRSRRGKLGSITRDINELQRQKETASATERTRLDREILRLRVEIEAQKFIMGEAPIELPEELYKRETTSDYTLIDVDGKYGWTGGQKIGRVSWRIPE